MPYYTPTDEAAMTAAYGRSLMGLAPMNFYLPAFDRTLNGLGALRFNRSVARGMYQLPFYEPPPQGRLGALGQVQVDPGLLFAGIGVLALGFFLLGGKHVPRLRKRRAERLRRKLRELEA